MAQWGYFQLSELFDVQVTAVLIDATTRNLMAKVPVFVEWDERWHPKPFKKVDWEKQR